MSYALACGRSSVFRAVAVYSGGVLSGCDGGTQPVAYLGIHGMSYEGCTDGYPVRWCAFDGGHTPGMVDGGGDDGARTWTKGEAWEFFSQF